MFIGHFAVGLAAKRAAPRTSIGTLTLAAVILDALWPGGPKVGLGLWDYPAVTVLIESAMFVAGVWIYASMTRARNRIGKAALGAYVLVLAALYIADAGSKSTPPSITVVVLTAIVAWLFVPWAYWIDTNREVRTLPHP